MNAKFIECPNCTDDTLSIGENNEYPPFYRIKNGVIERRIDCIGCPSIFSHEWSWKNQKWVNRKKISVKDWNFKDTAKIRYDSNELQLLKIRTPLRELRKMWIKNK